MACTASGTSVAWSGGIRMSTTTRRVPGRVPRKQLCPVAGLTHHLEPWAVQQAGEAGTKQHVVIGLGRLEPVPSESAPPS